MELYAEILSAALRCGKVEVSFPGGASLQEIVSALNAQGIDTGSRHDFS